MFLREKLFEYESYSFLAWNIRVLDDLGTFYRRDFTSLHYISRYDTYLDTESFFQKNKKITRIFLDFLSKGTKKLFYIHYFHNFFNDLKLRGRARYP